MSKNKKDIEIAKELDTTGLYCPEPLNELKKLGKTIEIGQCFKVLTDDPNSEKDFKQWAEDSKIEIIDSIREGNIMNFTFRKNK